MIMQSHSLELLLCLIWLVFDITTCERLDFTFSIKHDDWFREGIILELYCTHSTTNDTRIESPFEQNIVEGSVLVKGMTDKYEFQSNSTVSVLVIKILRRNDGGIYICSKAGRNKQYAQIHVLYSPSDKSPQCTSNYESPVIFDDLRQDYINFTCITDEGNPTVLITLNILESKSTHNISHITKICTEHGTFDKSLSFHCHMNESLQNATFLCNVTQQFPIYPYSSVYSRSCSFGPLHFISNFSIAINHENVTLTEGQDVNLTCTTNVSEVGIKWIGIPVDWEYHVTKDDFFSHLWVTHVKQQSTTDITVQCIGSYGNRNVTDSVEFNIINVQPGKTIVVIFILGIVVTVGLITFITAGIFIVCFHWKKCRRNIYKKRFDRYTTTVMAPNEIIEENIAELQGPHDHSIITFNSPSDSSNTKYYEIPLQSSENDVDDSGYLVPTSVHPEPPLYKNVANL